MPEKAEASTLASRATTPMMRQYHAIKEEVPDTLLLFRLGDFYELFYEDAVTAARELEITLTARQKERGSGIPMCGVPYHAAETYIAKLLRKGYKVAICDQTEPPKKGVKLVPRKVTRVITPGTLTDPAVLKSSENNFLLGLIDSDEAFGAAFLDVSTGEFRAFECRGANRFEELQLHLDHFKPREVVFPRSISDDLGEIENCARTPMDDWLFAEDAAVRTLLAQFRTASLDGFGLDGQQLAVSAAGALLHYARRTQRADLEHVSGLQCDTSSDYMVLDASSIDNLELVESKDRGGTRDSLLGVLDRSATAMGARLLRRWLLRPSIDTAEIGARHDAVAELVASSEAFGELRASLDGLSDIERLLGRITLGTASPRDLVSLRTALERLPELASVLGGLSAARFESLQVRLDTLDDLKELLLESIEEDPPPTLADGGVIRRGYDDDLDGLRRISEDSKSYLSGLESRERERTGISSLKVRYNRVFGYYIEISKANLHLVPEGYDRKQTLVGAERFITEELKEYEEKILTAEDRIVVLEKELFQAVREHIAAESPRVRASASVVAECDVLSTFADVARRYGHTRPEMSPDSSLVVSQGRHPVLEALAEDHRAERFIPNDLYMDSDQSRIHIITGPNMGGKSTFLRQNALILILAQMGAFVPARLARLPIVDRVFTRIGASDNLSRGRSTFMVEMTEAAIILHRATPQSMIILDEVGRGTATFDGLSIAWAIIEHIQSEIGAKTLFATHYHELTELADLLSGVKNFHVTVKEADEGITFLRKVEPGGADRSYGIEVARLAGIPPSVVARAREILKKHEETEHQLSDNLTVRARRKKQIVINQLALFTAKEEELRTRLREVDVERTAPLDALKLLAELKEEADEA